MKTIEIITAESFKPYGDVIAHDSRNANGFQVVLDEPREVGWRIAVSRIAAKSVDRIARHPNSRESFEPMEGVTLMCLAAPDRPADCRIFLLDKPVCLFKNVWHATLCLSETSLVKITENSVVDSEYFNLPAPLRVAVV